MIMKILIKAGVKVDELFSGKSIWLNSKVEEETFPNKTILFQHYDRWVFFLNLNYNLFLIIRRYFSEACQLLQHPWTNTAASRASMLSQSCACDAATLVKSESRSKLVTFWSEASRLEASAPTQPNVLCKHFHAHHFYTPWCTNNWIASVYLCLLVWTQQCSSCINW